MWIALGQDGAWTAAEHLAAAQVDALNIANWQRSGSGSKPEPLDRPADAAAKTRADKAHVGRAERYLARQKSKEASQ